MYDLNPWAELVNYTNNLPNTDAISIRNKAVELWNRSRTYGSEEIGTFQTFDFSLLNYSLNPFLAEYLTKCLESQINGILKIEHIPFRIRAQRQYINKLPTLTHEIVIIPNPEISDNEEAIENY